jgi:hypothetical protein
VVENFAKSSMETKITIIKLSTINLIPARLDAILSRIESLSGFLFPHITIKIYTINIPSIFMTGKLSLSLSN